jgi:hypothetical protein
MLADGETPVVIAGNDFSRLPYLDENQLDVRHDVANLASSIARKPFNNLGSLPRGVHLHWQLPEAMSEGETVEKTGATPGGLLMPAAPNRWLVVRSHSTQAIAKKCWIIESDYLYPRSVIPERAVCIPNRNSDKRAHIPYRYLGRQLSLENWRAEREQKPSNEYLENLSVLGWGTPYFSALYAECFSVFGCYDDEIIGLNAAQYCYEVYGWYADPAIPFDPNAEALDQWDVAGGTPPADTLLCYGKVTFTDELSLDDGIDTRDTQITLAKTSGEAFAAYLAKNQASEDDQAIRTENQIQALLFLQDLEGENVDYLNRLKLARHKEGFAPMDGGTLWRFIDDSSLITSNELDKSARDSIKAAFGRFKSSHNALLDRLNNVQDTFNQNAFNIQSQQSLLYSDWTKYMQCLHPTDRNSEGYPDADLVRHLIEHYTLPQLEAYEQYQQQLETRIQTSLNTLQDRFETQLIAAVGSGHPRNTFATKPFAEVPAPRYWQPTEPSVLIAGKVAAANNDLSAQQGKLICQMLEITALAETDTALADWLLSNDGLTGLNWAASAVNTWRCQPWQPFSLEWQINAYSDQNAQASLTANQMDYAPDFITAHYRIPLNDDEYSLPSASVDLKMDAGRAHGVESNPNVVKGRAQLTFSIKQIIEEKCRLFLKENGDFGDNSLDCLVNCIQQAADHLASHACLSQTLDGLNNELLMYSNLTLLTIGDPASFVADDAFALGVSDRVKQKLQGLRFKLPSVGQRFMPIKSGINTLGALRVIDTFGRFKDLDCKEVVRPQRGLVGASFYSPPRVIQPLRLSLRWSNHKDDAAGLYTPIAGWLNYNLFDASLDFYHHAGELVGRINSDGEWVNFHGQLQTLAQVRNPTLSQFIDKLLSFHCRNRLLKTPFLSQPLDGLPLEKREALWDTLVQRELLSPNEQGEKAYVKPFDRASWPSDLDVSFTEAKTLFASSQAKKNHFPALKKAILRGQDNIEPDLNAQVLGVSDSRPLAIVTASIGFQLMGLPECNKSWDALAHDLKSNQRCNRLFTDVKLPIKLGEFNNLDDSLVAYWRQNANGQLSKNGYFPPSGMDDIEDWIDSANFNVNEHDYIDQVTGEGVANLNHTLNARPLQLLLLMDPEGTVHATSGVVPTKRLSLDPMLYRDALEKIQTGYFIGPLLTPTSRLSIPVPSKTIWRWEQMQTDGGIRQQLSVQLTDKRRFIESGCTEDDWQALLKAGVLQAGPGDDGQAYYAAPIANAVPDNLSDALRQRWRTLAKALTASTQAGITPDHLVAPFSEKIKAVEGWLRPVSAAKDKASN